MVFPALSKGDQFFQNEHCKFLDFLKTYLIHLNPLMLFLLLMLQMTHLWTVGATSRWLMSSIDIIPIIFDNFLAFWNGKIFRFILQISCSWLLYLSVLCFLLSYVIISCNCILISHSVYMCTPIYTHILPFLDKW